MNVEDQIKKIAEEAEAFVNSEPLEEEREVGWIETQHNLSDEEKLAVLKDVARYYFSDEFKSLVKEFSSKIPEVDKEIRSLIVKRKKTESTRSFVDRCLVYIEAIEEIKAKTTSEVFKNYLQARIDSFDSMMTNKKGSVAVAETVEVLVDSPIFSDVDMLKAKKEIYISVDAFMKYVVSIYDYKKLMEKKEKQEDNPHQPYS